MGQTGGAGSDAKGHRERHYSTQKVTIAPRIRACGHKEGSEGARRRIARSGTVPLPG